VTANRGGITFLLRDNPAALRWRSQFAPEPARRYRRFHWIAERDHGLMSVLANEKNGMRIKPLPVSRESTERSGGLPTLFPLR
jgi:hypothetical protein